MTSINCKYAKYHNDGQLHAMNESGYRCTNETIKSFRSIDCPFDWNDELGKLVCKYYMDDHS